MRVGAPWASADSVHKVKAQQMQDTPQTKEGVTPLHPIHIVDQTRETRVARKELQSHRGIEHRQMRIDHHWYRLAVRRATQEKQRQMDASQEYRPAEMNELTQDEWAQGIGTQRRHSQSTSVTTRSTRKGCNPRQVAEADRAPRTEMPAATPIHHGPGRGSHPQRQSATVCEKGLEIEHPEPAGRSHP